MLPHLLTLDQLEQLNGKRKEEPEEDKPTRICCCVFSCFTGSDQDTPDESSPIRPRSDSESKFGTLISAPDFVCIGNPGYGAFNTI